MTYSWELSYDLWPISFEVFWAKRSLHVCRNAMHLRHAAATKYRTVHSTQVSLRLHGSASPCSWRTAIPSIFVVSWQILIPCRPVGGGVEFSSHDTLVTVKSSSQPVFTEALYALQPFAQILAKLSIRQNGGEPKSCKEAKQQAEFFLLPSLKPHEAWVSCCCLADELSMT